MAKKLLSEIQKYSWLNEHGPYELCMLRYSLSKLVTTSNQLDYNAYFECFAAKARVLYDFLGNRQKKGNDVRAADFTSSYRCPNIEPVKMITRKLPGHAGHASTERPKTTEEKITRDHCIKLANWIEQAMDEFLSSLDPDTFRMWAHEKAGFRAEELSIGESTPSASSFPMFG